MSKKLFILALAIFALVGFTTMASAGGKVLGPGGSTTCNGDIVVKSKTGGNLQSVTGVGVESRWSVRASSHCFVEAL